MAGELCMFGHEGAWPAVQVLCRDGGMAVGTSRHSGCSTCMRWRLHARLLWWQIRDNLTIGGYAYQIGHTTGNVDLVWQTKLLLRLTIAIRT